ncbi:MAG: twin-arginine translocation signal domain-containing protein [Planctomycetota bacterium]
MTKHRNITRRDFLQKGAAAALAAPLFINSRVFGANDRIVMGCVGMGGQGRGDMGGFMGFGDVRVVAVCDGQIRQQGLQGLQGLPRCCCP